MIESQPGKRHNEIITYRREIITYREIHWNCYIGKSVCFSKTSYKISHKKFRTEAAILYISRLLKSSYVVDYQKRFYCISRLSTGIFFIFVVCDNLPGLMSN